MLLQPVFGFLHHAHFKRHQRRGLVSYVHIFYGRSLMLLGIINGGLGLKLARAPRSAITTYTIIAGLFGLLYALIAMIMECRRWRKGRRGASKQGTSESGNGRLTNLQRPESGRAVVNPVVV